MEVECWVDHLGVDGLKPQPRTKAGQRDLFFTRGFPDSV